MLRLLQQKIRKLRDFLNVPAPVSHLHVLYRDRVLVGQLAPEAFRPFVLHPGVPPEGFEHPVRHFVVATEQKEDVLLLV
jgi:hypothetical protein